MIKEVLEYYGADVSRIRPGCWQPIRCPFHGDEHESASVCVGRPGEFGAFRCHGCGVRGDAITLLMQQEGLNRHAALKRATEIAGGVGKDVQQRSLQGNRLPGRARPVRGVRGQ